MNKDNDCLNSFLYSDTVLYNSTPQHLSNWTTWDKSKEFWNCVNSLFKRRFRHHHRRRLLWVSLLANKTKCSRTSIIRTRITAIPRKLELNFLSLDQNLTEKYPDNSNSLPTRTVFRFPSEFELTGFYYRTKGASWLFKSNSTKCLYAATWNLSGSPELTVILPDYNIMLPDQFF